MQGTQSRVSNPLRPPYSAVGLLRMHFTDGNWYWGSGALINNQQVLTCGHNLFDVPNQHQADQIWFYPGWNGDARPVVAAGPGQTLYIAARCAFYVAAYNDRTRYPQGQTEWDIGLVNLNAPVNPAPPIYFTPVQTNNESLVNHDLNLAGYPGNHSGQMWVDRLPVEKIFLQYNTLSHLHDTFQGSSGSPMYTEDADGAYLYAVHVEGPNDLRRATLLTPAITQKLNNTAYHAPHAGFVLHAL